jgi:hypothetical protein
MFVLGKTLLDIISGGYDTVLSFLSIDQLQLSLWDLSTTQGYSVGLFAIRFTQLDLEMRQHTAQLQVLALVKCLAPGNAYCHSIHAGVFFNYCSAQVCVWLASHVTFLFWAVNFPFSYRGLWASGRIKYAYITVVLLALVIPLPGALVPLKDGYFAARNPTLFCTGRNTDHRYYTFVLPISIMSGTNAYLLILICWKIVEVRVILKPGTPRVKSSNSTRHIHY